MRIFQIPRGNKRRCLSLVKLKSSPDFLLLNSTTDIYSEFGKIFSATASRGVGGALLFKDFAEDYCLLMSLVLLSCETNLNSIYRLKTVTYIYVKLWVLDNLVLFLQYHSHSDILIYMCTLCILYIYVYIYIYIYIPICIYIYTYI